MGCADRIMNLNEILKIEESSTIEFKELVNDSVFKSLSAFSNTNGGQLYIGISDRKEVWDLIVATVLSKK